MRVLRKYGQAATIAFGLRDYFTGESYDAALASGDTKVDKDGGGWANTATAVPPETQDTLYELALTATEMQAKRITIKVVDQTDPKAFQDQKIHIETYGHASAQIKTDLDLLETTVLSAHGATDGIIAIVDTVVDAIKLKTDNLPASPASAADVLEELIADHSGVAGSLAEYVKFIQDVLEADVTVDTGTTPYQLVFKIKSTSTELIRKDLKQVDGSDFTALTQTVGQHVEGA